MGQANCCCGSREALTDIEPVLSADVRLTRGRKRSERRLLLLREELLMAKLHSRARKELWVGTLLGTPEGAKRARVTRLPSLKLLEKELSRRHAWRTVSVRSLERLMEGQAEADPKQGPPPVPAGNGGDFAAHQAPGQAGCGCSKALFGQPLAALCREDGTLPQPIQELLAVLQREGPSTEGIFRRAASGTALRELREALDRGADVDLGSQPALLLAVVLKDFLRSIPSKLLINDLYEDWMAAMQKSSKEEKIEELKAVAEKLPAANLLLLKRLLSLLQHIGRNAATSRMTPSNLAICVGPNLLSPANEDLLPLEVLIPFVLAEPL
ncbi:T-cell activation Rho GTPase-activating protein-like [Ciconia boyciana]|uniref:T-cell activation Rho GTPase-activating protein-like n=1 Tax=Ciconia boyciana TaxID=52775 RepID=UPI003B9DD408